MLRKILTWPDGQQAYTLVFKANEFLHLLATSMTGPFAGVFFVAPMVECPEIVGVVTPVQAILVFDSFSGETVGDQRFTPLSFNVLDTAKGPIKAKVFLKGKTKKTHIFIALTQGAAKVMRVDCELPSDPEWDRRDIEHEFILRGTPVENRTQAYATAKVQTANVNTTWQGSVPEQSLWSNFDSQPQLSGTSLKVQVTNKVICAVGETGTQFGTGAVALDMSRHADSCVLAYSGNPRRWAHVFTEIVDMAGNMDSSCDDAEETDE